MRSIHAPSYRDSSTQHERTMAKPLLTRSRRRLSLAWPMLLLCSTGCSGSGEGTGPSSEVSNVGGSSAATTGSANGGSSNATQNGSTQSATSSAGGAASSTRGSPSSSGGVSASGASSAAVGGAVDKTAANTGSSASGLGGARTTTTKPTQSSQATGGTRSSSTKPSGGAAGASTGGKAAGGSGTGGKAAGGSTSSSAKSTGGASVGGAISTDPTSTGGAATSTFPVGSGKPTVYIAGDSTAQTYAANSSDQQGWGQRISELFTTDVVFVNKAMGGRSSKSYIDEGRLDEILALIKQGDYLFAQWGINDRYQSDPARYTDPATTFRTYLKQYIDGARKKNAIPVLLTPTPRHQYVNGVFENGFAAYCDAIKAVGKETNTPVIDVQTKALAYYTSIGEEAVSSTIILDVLHFKSAGAYQMARIVAVGVHESILPISKFVIESKLNP